MADPIALQILNALVTRLQVIATGSGYNTDLGSNINLGKRAVTQDEITASGIAFVYDETDDIDDDLSTIYENVGITMPAVVEAYILPGATDATTKMHYMLQDIKRAIFLADRTLSGLAVSVDQGSRSVIYPEAGGEYVGVSQSVTVRFVETYGNP